MRTGLIGFMAAGLLGCSNDVQYTDAGQTDGSAVDGGGADDAAGPPDAAGTGVRVQVLGWLTGRGLPVEGAAVLFQDASGAVVERATSDAEGRASTELETVDMVTVLNTTDGVIATILAVEPGDALVFGLPRQAGTTFQSATIALPPSGTGQYRVATPCGSGTGSATLLITFGDACEATGPLLAVHLNGMAVDAFIHAPSVTIGAGQTVPVAGPWQTPGALDVALTGMDDVTSSQMLFSIVDDGYALGASNTLLPVQDAGAIDATVAIPTGVGDGTIVELHTFRDSDGVYRHVHDRAIGPRSSFALDGTDLLPAPVLEAADATGASWENGGTAHDGTLVSISLVTKGKGEEAGWLVVAPPDATSVELPPLPADLDGYWPGGAVTAELTTVESTAVDGYRGMRADAMGATVPPFELDGPVRVRVARLTPY